MNKTRNVFILKGELVNVNSVIGMLNFKGLTILSSSKVTNQDVINEFNNNKSIVCTNVPHQFEATAININVINSISPTDDELPDCINLALDNICEQFHSIAEKYECDIGDHKSNSSGLTRAPSSKDCSYCKYLSDTTIYNLKDFTQSNRTIYASDNFIVMPTLGEFVKGYLLIIPREHVMSIAELSPELKEEFLYVLDDVVSILKLTYPVNDILVWENGTGNGGIGKAKDSIVHSHVHVAPSQLTAEKIENLSGFSFTKIPYQDLGLFGTHSYLLIKGNLDNEWYINDNPNLYIPRQYVRQLIADEYGFTGDVWNWRTNHFVYLIVRTCHDIQDALINNWDLLPERIRQNTKNFFVY